MSTLTLPFTFTGGTSAVAAQVDSNFTTIYNWANTNAMWTDASRAFTAVPSGPGTDPTSANQLTRKSYVDMRVLGPNTTPNCSIQFGFTSVTFATGGANLTFPTPFPTICNAAVANITLNNPWTVNVIEVHTTFAALRAWNTETGGWLNGAAFVFWFAAGH